MNDPGLHKGQKIKVSIESLAAGGEGVSRQTGIPTFVERVAPGDVVEIELFDVRKNFARGKLKNILQPSPHRAQPPCPLFKVCGGCQWQHLSYQYQLDAKQDIVRQSLKHIGKFDLDKIEVRQTIASQKTLLYRNKAQFPVKHPQGQGRILAGYYKQDSHELVNIKHCPVQPQAMDVVLERVKEVWEKHGLSAYDERRHTGLLRHINLRFSFAAQKVLLTLVLNYKADCEQDFDDAPFSADLGAAVSELMDETTELAGVCANFNAQRGNKILGDFTLPLAGACRIEEVLQTARPDLPVSLQNGLRFSLSSTSFFQVNTDQAVHLLEIIYDAVAELALPAPVVIDAYAGVGAIALWLSGIASDVVAIEEHPAAVADGKLNVRLNAATNVEFRLGRVEDVLPQIMDDVRADVIVLDPPRKGVSAEAIKAIVDARPQRIIYVSCNCATLARDLRLIEEIRLPSGDKQELVGYKTKQVQPIDLFPQTFHVESVTVLERFRC